MLSEQIKKFFKELGYEVYMDRESHVRVKALLDQYGMEYFAPVSNSASVKMGTEVLTVNFKNQPGTGGFVVNNLSLVDYTKESSISFSISEFESLGKIATIKAQQPFYTEEIMLTSTGGIKVFSSDSTQLGYSYTDQQSNAKELADYLKKIDSRLIPIIKYCGSVIGSSELSAAINVVVDYNKGKKRVYRPTLPNTQPSKHEQVA